MSKDSSDWNQPCFLWGFFHNFYTSDLANLKRQEAKLVANREWTVLSFHFIGKELFFPSLLPLPGTGLQNSSLFDSSWNHHFVWHSPVFLKKKKQKKNLHNSASQLTRMYYLDFIYCSCYFFISKLKC